MRKLFILNLLFLNCSICLSQQSVIDSLQAILRSSKEDTNKVNVLERISKNYFVNVSYDSAFKYAILAKDLAKKINFPKGQVSASNKIASYYYVQGNYEKALANFFASLKILKNSGDKITSAKVYNIIGNVYYDMGDYPKAVNNQRAALKISEGLKDLEGMGRSYNNIGNIFHQQGNYPEALKNHLSALQIREQIGDKHGIATSFHNIANVYSIENDYKQALKNYLTALKGFKEAGDKRDIATCYMETGRTYAKLELYNEALKYCFTSMQLNKQYGDKLGVGSAYLRIAEIYFKTKNYDEALKNNFEALQIASEIGNQPLNAEAKINIGSVFFTLKDYAKAIKYLEDGLKISKEIGSLDGIKISSGLLSEIWEIKGNYKLSLQYFKAYTAARDSLFNEENTKKMVRSEMNFQFAKKEAISELEKKGLADKNQIQFLQISSRNYIMLGLGILLLVIVSIAWLVLRQNKLRSEQTAIQLEQKLLRSQMNPHFIFNALATIESFIYENQPKEAGRYLSDFARLMRLILDNSTTEYITLEKEIKTLEYYLSLQKLRLENNLIYSIEVSDTLDPSDVLIPPMLTQPFIENAIEHGFRGSKQTGEITISFKEINNQLVVEVKDNGIGINKAKENEKQKQHRSMALQITKERLAVLNRSKKQKLTFSISDISDELQQNTGTKVVFSIPL